VEPLTNRFALNRAGTALLLVGLGACLIVGTNGDGEAGFFVLPLWTVAAALALSALIRVFGPGHSGPGPSRAAVLGMVALAIAIAVGSAIFAANAVRVPADIQSLAKLNFSSSDNGALRADSSDAQNDRIAEDLTGHGFKFASSELHADDHMHWDVEVWTRNGVAISLSPSHGKEQAWVEVGPAKER